MKRQRLMSLSVIGCVAQAVGILASNRAFAAEIGPDAAVLAGPVSDQSSFLYLIVAALSLAVTVAIAISFALDAVQKHHRQIGHSRRYLDNAFSQLDRKIAGLSQTVLSLQKALEEKDEQLRRYREGYDAHIYRRVIARLIPVRQAIDDIKRDGAPQDETLHQLECLLDEALADCRVEPDIETDFRSAEGLAEIPLTTSGDSAADEFKIADVVGAGHRIAQDERTEIVVPPMPRTAGLP